MLCVCVCVCVCVCLLAANPKWFGGAYGETQPETVFEEEQPPEEDEDEEVRKAREKAWLVSNTRKQ